MTRPQVPCVIQKGPKSQICGIGQKFGVTLSFQHQKGQRGRVGSSGIRLGRDQAIWSRTCIQIQHGLVKSHCVGTSHGLTRTHMTHHGLDSGEATTFPFQYSLQLCAEATSKWLFFPGLSRWSPETVPVWTPGTLGNHNFSPEFGSRRGLNQSCISLRELSNAMSHTVIGHRKEVDSRLLVVGSQTANLTSGPSFAHNLGCRCPNGQ